MSDSFELFLMGVAVVGVLSGFLAMFMCLYQGWLECRQMSKKQTKKKRPNKNKSVNKKKKRSK